MGRGREENGVVGLDLVGRTIQECMEVNTFNRVGGTGMTLLGGENV